MPVSQNENLGLHTKRIDWEIVCVLRFWIDLVSTEFTWKSIVQ